MVVWWYGRAGAVCREIARLVGDVAYTSLTQSLPLPPKTAPSAGPRGPQLPSLQLHGGGAKSRLAATTRLNSYVAATAPLNERLAMSNEVAMRRTTNLFKLGRPWSPRRSEPARSWRPQTSG